MRIASFGSAWGITITNAQGVMNQREEVIPVTSLRRISYGERIIDNDEDVL